MPRHHVTLSHESGKSLHALYALLSDHSRLGPVLGVPVKRIRDGAPGVNDTGSVRRIGIGPLAIEETVTACETDRSIDYQLTRGGFPIRNHHGRLDFHRTDGGSRVDWYIEFDSTLPGAGILVAAVLKRAIARGLKNIG